MLDDEIIVIVNGTRFGGWKAAEATTSIESVCGQFSVELMDKWTEESQPIEIKLFDECQVLLGDEPVITGYIDNVSPAIDADSHSVNISGRDKTCDLVDCSATVPSFELCGLDLAAIAQQVCSEFDGIEVKVETDVGKPFDRFAVQPGETAFSCIERAAKQRGVLLTTDGDGRLVLSAKGVFKDTGDALIYGQNIKKIALNRDGKNRFQTYTVHGQMPAFSDGADDPVHDQIGEARDPNIMRRRPLILTAESWTRPDAARTRAENEACCRAGNSLRVNVAVAGWRQSSGALWKPGLKVSVTAPPVYLADNTVLVISTVRYSYSDSDGTIAELELKPPDAFLESGRGEVGDDPIDD